MSWWFGCLGSNHFWFAPSSSGLGARVARPQPPPPIRGFHTSRGIDCPLLCLIFAFTTSAQHSKFVDVLKIARSRTIDVASARRPCCVASQFEFTHSVVGCREGAFQTSALPCHPL